jgi:hypothetical protein
MEQLVLHDITFKLELFEERGAQNSMASFDIYVHENEEEDAINILQDLQPEITYEKLPKCKAAEMHTTISYIIIGIIILVLVLIYVLELMPVPE